MTPPFRIDQGDWSTLGEHAGLIRKRVFVDEQQVPTDEEWDGRDPECVHFMAYVDGQPAGTARLLPDGHIGRVAVLASQRGKGIGQALMLAAIEAAHDQRLSRVVLSAQTHALAFYEQLGFEPCGDIFMEAGIAHRNMTLNLPM